MNPIIQSLVQSPFIRTMSAVPSKSEDLVHGVDNHMPPLSRHKVKIFPRTGTTSSDKYRFEIPRRDYLDKLTLVVRPKATRSVFVAQYGQQSADEWVGHITKSIYTNFLGSIDLYSKNRFIERLEPEAIWHEEAVRGLTDDLQTMFHYAFNTFDVNSLTDAVSDTDILPWPQRSAKRTELAVADYGDVQAKKLLKAQFHIPLPFCSLSLVKKNLQTNFLETLTVEIQMKWCKMFQELNSGYDMYLEASYHQFHPSVETVIRNANYKPSIPATLPWWEWVEFTNVLSRPDSLSPTARESVVSYLLDSDALISELLITPRVRSKTFDVDTWLMARQNLYIVISSNGEVLVEGDAYSFITDKEYRFGEEDRGVAHAFIGDGTIPIRFGMKYGEVFTGGLALASMSNVVCSVYASEMAYRNPGSASLLSDRFMVPNNASYDVYDVKIVGKRHFILRIDSDTGVVSRSIDS